MKTVAIINDDAKEAEFISIALSHWYITHLFSTPGEASRTKLRDKPQVLIVDIETCKKYGFSDIETLCKDIEPSANVVCIVPDVRTLPKLPKHIHILQKPYDANALCRLVRYASASPSPDFTSDYQSTYEVSAFTHANLIGSSDKIKKAIKLIHLYAQSNAPVLIIGESGTGKELAAEAIHFLSPRNKFTFLPVDCATLASNLTESILFGTVKGAYTDSVDKKGVFESAHGGTVFLDEIGELEKSTQAKLLRTLETSAGARVGSVNPIKYDVRILSATNARFLRDQAQFRPELLHRISTLVLEMPALRTHKTDIPALVTHFLKKMGNSKNITQNAMEKLMDWDWPGNVRELYNAIKRASVLSCEKQQIDAEHIDLEPIASVWQESLFGY